MTTESTNLYLFCYWNYYYSIWIPNSNTIFTFSIHIKISIYIQCHLLKECMKNLILFYYFFPKVLLLLFGECLNVETTSGSAQGFLLSWLYAQRLLSAGLKGSNVARIRPWVGIMQVKFLNPCTLFTPFLRFSLL